MNNVAEGSQPERPPHEDGSRELRGHNNRGRPQPDSGSLVQTQFLTGHFRGQRDKTLVTVVTSVAIESAECYCAQQHTVGAALAP